MKRSPDTNGRGHDHNDEPSAAPTCPICGNAVPREAESFPFCSPRCRKIDLGKWLKEEYKVSRPIEQSDIDQE